MNLADLINEPYFNHDRLGLALARLAEADAHAPFCQIPDHRQRWGPGPCGACLVPFTAGVGQQRAALYLKQHPGEAPYAELRVYDGHGRHVVVRMDAKSLADLGAHMIASSAWIEAAS